MFQNCTPPDQHTAPTGSLSGLGLSLAEHGSADKRSGLDTEDLRASSSQIMVKRPHNRGLPFIVTTDRGKTDPDTRKLIRSHVMRGKNRVKARKRPQANEHGDLPCSGGKITDGSVWTPSISRLLCSNLSAIRFADATVEPAIIADVVFFSSMFSKAMFVLNPCMLPKTVAMERAWLSPLVFDAAYLNAICLTVQAFLDGFLARTRSVESLQRDCVYFAKTVRILQDRLGCDDDSTKLSNSTIMTVLALSAHAYMMGEHESSGHHINGLLKLVSMRGVETFFRTPKLLIEILRSDLVMANDQGSKPVLFTYTGIPWPLQTEIDWMRAYKEGFAPAQHSNTRQTFPRHLDPELAAVWGAMASFCATVNAATPEAGIKMSEEAFLHSMGAIMYRLLHQQYERGSLNEVFRMGLLAFSSPIFLNWNRIELPDPRFTSTYREALATIDPRSSMVSAEEYHWLLMVGALLMAHEPKSFAWIQPRLRASIESCGLSSWNDVQRTLNSFLWIALVYDRPGQEIYVSVMV